MISISVVYRRTSKGALSVMFAADLVRRLGEETLYVIAPVDAADGTTATNNDVALLPRQRELIVEDVRRTTALKSVVFVPTPLSGIVIDHGQTAEYDEVDTLYPRLETTLCERGCGPIVVPFGDSLEAVLAAERGFALARGLSLPVVLYHTTWIDRGCKSTNPEDHMCPEAIVVKERLTKLATDQGLQVKSVVETAEDVVEGIVRCGMRESARLIVMSRSSKTTVGCYVDQALKQSPISLLAIAALDRRRA